MKFALVVCLIALVQAASAVVTGSNFVRHLTADEGNLSANAQSNQASGKINQSTALNGGGNVYTNQDRFGKGNLVGNSYQGSFAVQAGNVGGNLKSNQASVGISQVGAANNVKNTLVNQFAGMGKIIGDDHTQLERARVANVAASVNTAQGSNNVKQNNVGNSGANTFKNNYGSSSSSPYSSSLSS